MLVRCVIEEWLLCALGFDLDLRCWNRLVLDTRVDLIILSLFECFHFCLLDLTLIVFCTLQKICIYIPKEIILCICSATSLPFNLPFLFPLLLSFLHSPFLFFSGIPIFNTRKKELNLEEGEWYFLPANHHLT